MEPGCLEKRVEQVLSASVNYSRTNDEYFHVLSLHAQYFILYIFYIIVFFKRNSLLIVSIFKVSVNDRLLLLFLRLLAFFLLCVPVVRVLRFGLFNLFFGFLFDAIFRRGWGFGLFDLPFARTPSHDVADKDENFIIFEGFGHHLDGEVEIVGVCLVDVVDVHLALLDCFFAEEFGFLSFKDFFDAIGFGVEGVDEGAHVGGLFGGFLDELVEEGAAEGGVQVVDEIFFGHAKM